MDTSKEQDTCQGAPCLLVFVLLLALIIVVEPGVAEAVVPQVPNTIPSVPCDLKDFAPQHQGNEGVRFKTFVLR